MHLDWEVQDWEGQRFIYLENWTIGENHSVINNFTYFFGQTLHEKHSITLKLGETNTSIWCIRHL